MQGSRLCVQEEGCCTTLYAYATFHGETRIKLYVIPFVMFF